MRRRLSLNCSLSMRREASPWRCEETTWRLRVEFQWFLMALSVRPGSSFAISAHRFCSRLWASMSKASSSGVQRSLRTLGSSWLCHRSRICFPVRPGRCMASDDQDLRPWILTSCMTVSSSSFVHGHFITCLLPSCFDPSSLVGLQLRSSKSPSLALSSRARTCFAASTKSAICNSCPSSWISEAFAALTCSLRWSIQRCFNLAIPSLLASRTTDVRCSSGTLIDPVYKHSNISLTVSGRRKSESSSILSFPDSVRLISPFRLALENRCRKYSLPDARTSLCASNSKDPLTSTTSHNIPSDFNCRILCRIDSL
mmetsp:Transcript_26908/g.54814  ORF Transcript_26908/g.54814 Transcript_26908/m.54814 type:complete len:313 (-) Transcript_26908:428-1366(-)